MLHVFSDTNCFSINLVRAKSQSTFYVNNNFEDLPVFKNKTDKKHRTQKDETLFFKRKGRKYKYKLLQIISIEQKNKVENKVENTIS